MEYFRTAQEFIELFDIDPEQGGAHAFIELSEYLSLMMHFHTYGVTVSKLSRAMMQRAGMSPKVYWSRMKTALMPIFKTDPATLRAMGLPVGGGLTLTCPYLAECVALVTEHYVPDNRTMAEIAEKIAGEVKALG